jgi:hypothetical protein
METMRPTQQQSSEPSLLLLLAVVVEEVEEEAAQTAANQPQVRSTISAMISIYIPNCEH